MRGERGLFVQWEPASCLRTTTTNYRMVGKKDIFMQLPAVSEPPQPSKVWWGRRIYIFNYTLCHCLFRIIIFFLFAFPFFMKIFMGQIKILYEHHSEFLRISVITSGGGWMGVEGGQNRQNMQMVNNTIQESVGKHTLWMETKHKT